MHRIKNYSVVILVSFIFSHPLWGADTVNIGGASKDVVVVTNPKVNAPYVKTIPMQNNFGAGLFRFMQGRQRTYRPYKPLGEECRMDGECLSGICSFPHRGAALRCVDNNVAVGDECFEERQCAGSRSGRTTCTAERICRVTVGNACESSDQCDIGTDCIDGTCLASNHVSCQSNAECESGVCVLTSSVSTLGDGTRVISDDTYAHWWCVRDNVSWGNPCSSTEECAEGLVCGYQTHAHEVRDSSLCLRPQEAAFGEKDSVPAPGETNLPRGSDCIQSSQCRSGVCEGEGTSGRYPIIGQCR